MSDINAEKQALLDQIHRQFRHAITYNLYTGIAYGTLHHYHSPLPHRPSSGCTGMLFVVYFLSIRIQL
jgi:hypothetical protein